MVVPKLQREKGQVVSDIDVYQQRYLDHMDRKRESIKPRPAERTFWNVLRSRRSQRSFSSYPLSEDTLNHIYEAIRLAPSSCNRQAIVVKKIAVFSLLKRLEELLVGGAGWLSGASVVLLLFADMEAYKSPIEKDYMPWLDAGFVAQNVYLAAEAMGIGCCYVNPHIKGKGVQLVDQQLNPRSLRFCGAIALGHYDTRGPKSPKRAQEGTFY